MQPSDYHINKMLNSQLMQLVQFYIPTLTRSCTCEEDDDYYCINKTLLKTELKSLLLCLEIII